MTLKISWALCLVAALGSIILGCLAETSLTTGDPLLVLLVVGPYALLALLAWRHQGRPVLAKIVLAFVILMSACGLYYFGLEWYRNLGVQHRGMYTSLLFYVPILQGVVVVVLGVVLLGVDLATRKRVPESRVSP